jgi:glucosylceramidase
MARPPGLSLTRTAIVGFAALGLVAAPRPGKAAEVSPPGRSSVRVWVTARDTGERLEERKPAPFEPLAQPDENEPTVMVDPSKAFQVIEGLGGALTDAAAETWAKLPAERQRELLAAYFDREKGIGYSLCRTHIHSCDFSSESYSYAEVPGDADLRHFSLERDRRHRLPFVRAALLAAGGPVKVFASPWSPPAWMKTNGSMLQGGLMFIGAGLLLVVLGTFLERYRRTLLRSMEERSAS